MGAPQVLGERANIGAAMLEQQCKHIQPPLVDNGVLTELILSNIEYGTYLVGFEYRMYPVLDDYGNSVVVGILTIVLSPLDKGGEKPGHSLSEGRRDAGNSHV